MTPRFGGGFKPAVRVSPEPAARLRRTETRSRKAHAPLLAFAQRAPLALSSSEGGTRSPSGVRLRLRHLLYLGSQCVGGVPPLEAPGVKPQDRSGSPLTLSTLLVGDLNMRG